jgi:hypothetical protein
MELGMITIAIGFLLLIRYKRTNNHNAFSEENGQDKTEKVNEKTLNEVNQS